MSIHTVTFQLSDAFYEKLAGQTLKTCKALKRGVVIELNMELKKTENGIEVNMLDEDGDMIACQSVEWSYNDTIIIAEIKALTTIKFP